jgi:hypothetical protein
MIAQNYKLNTVNCISPKRERDTIQFTLPIGSYSFIQFIQLYSYIDPTRNNAKTCITL